MPEILTEPDRPCWLGCTHSAAEHAAFDAGERAGRAGRNPLENPHTEYLLAFAWSSGHSVGDSDSKENWRVRKAKGNT